MRILVAEDDRLSRRLAVSSVEAWGYDAESVDDGEAALERLVDPAGPHLALLDWEMPHRDGPSVCEALRGEDGPSRPLYLLLLTGRTDPEDLVAGLAAGADDFVAKPFVPVELQARLDVGRRMVTLQSALRDQQKYEGAMEMAGAVCHELNQPLQAVRSWSEMLRAETESDSFEAEALENIVEGVTRLGTLTRKLMGLTHYRTKDYMAGRRQIIDLHDPEPTPEKARVP